MSMDISVYKVLGQLPVSTPVSESSRIIAVSEKDLPKLRSVLPQDQKEVKLLPNKDYAIVHLSVEELGYMRKPFRTFDDASTPEDESSFFIADNLKTAIKGLSRIEHPELSDNNYAVLGFDDLPLLDELGNYAYDPGMWVNSITDVISRTSIVVLDW